MQKLAVVFGFALLFVIAGCSTDRTANDAEGVNKSCLLSIDGMVCEKGCKTTIANTLSEVEGVYEVTVDYDESVALVNYNDSKLSSNDLIDVVGTIANGQYTALLIEEHDVNDAQPATGSSESAKGASVDNYSFAVPDLVGFFGHIF